jgi:hypothetical protein
MNLPLSGIGRLDIIADQPHMPLAACRALVSVRFRGRLADVAPRSDTPENWCAYTGFNRRTIRTLCNSPDRAEFGMSRTSKIFIALVIALTPLTVAGCGSSCAPGASSCFVL